MDKEQTKEAKNAEMRERKVGGLWIKGSEDRPHIFIQIEKIDEFGRRHKRSYVAFTNKFKKEDNNQPDYEVYICREDYEKMKSKKPKTIKKTELNEVPKEQVTTEDSEL